MDTLLEVIVNPKVKEYALDIMKHIYWAKPPFTNEFVINCEDNTSYGKMIRALHFSQTTMLIDCLLENLPREATREDVLTVIQSNYLNFLTTLIKDPLFLSKSFKTDLFNNAVFEGWIEIVQILLQDSEVDFANKVKREPFGDEFVAMEEAVLRNNAKMVALLLKSGKINPAENNALFMACKQGLKNIVELFLTDPRIDGNHKKKALVCACSVGHEDIVKLLLSDVQLIDAKCKALLVSINHNFPAITKMLLMHPGCPASLSEMHELSKDSDISSEMRSSIEEAITEMRQKFNFFQQVPDLPSTNQNLIGESMIRSGNR